MTPQKKLQGQISGLWTALDAVARDWGVSIMTASAIAKKHDIPRRKCYGRTYLDSKEVDNTTVRIRAMRELEIRIAAEEHESGMDVMTHDLPKHSAKIISNELQKMDTIPEYLARCPFCGGRAELVHAAITSHVECKTCGSRGVVSSARKHAEQASNGWNHRVAEHFPADVWCDGFHNHGECVHLAKKDGDFECTLCREISIYIDSRRLPE